MNVKIMFLKYVVPQFLNASKSANEHFPPLLENQTCRFSMKVTTLRHLRNAAKNAVQDSL